MRFWSGTPFTKTTEVVAVAQMFDAGYDGLISSDPIERFAETITATVRG
jgi:hypothetical protein